MSSTVTSFLGILFVGSTLLIVPAVASAHVPVIVSQESIKDIDTIEDPELSQAFYGELTGFPHTFEIRAKEPFTLSLQILQPDIESSIRNISGIAIKDLGRGKRVEEVTRLHARDALWESEYEPWGGDRYLIGPSFKQELSEGIYRIEIHTPDNLEKYVLVVGSREEMTLGYFELIGRLMEVKEFFGKSKLRIVESPFVYVPLILSMLLIGYGVYRKRKKR